ncbi:CPBP family intramembrane metalloprotease, partial [Christensenellaceae bacterium OttesenSCG-928-K19]|nr:CPBP family intramembrane metalloprotease [Christensenellaceae bacterium OttesenSCG-928-K19]
TVCILAPIAEEFIFRKLLIDRLARYGQWVAVFTSALLFGLFHGNFSQFFYAFGAGLVFGYVYIKTGKVWYTMLLHGIINTIPFLLMPLIEGVGGLGLLLFTGLLLLCIAIAGGTLLIVNLARKRIRFTPRVSILPQKGWGKIIFLNPGMICLLIGCAGYFCISIFTPA